MKKIIENKVIGIFVHDFRICQKLEKFKEKLVTSVIKRKMVNGDEQENKRRKNIVQVKAKTDGELATTEIVNGTEIIIFIITFFE